MKFDLSAALEILERTPKVLETLLGGISDEWAQSNEGIETWSPYDIVGHFIHGEKTDWIPRMKIILKDIEDKQFAPFDRFAQFENSKGKSLNELLEEFKALRKENIKTLRLNHISSSQLIQTGIHPAFGEVNLSQLLSTWVVHDLNHISQITRVMAKQYSDEVGPWKEYLGILNK